MGGENTNSCWRHKFLNFPPVLFSSQLPVQHAVRCRERFGARSSSGEATLEECVQQARPTWRRDASLSSLLSSWPRTPPHGRRPSTAARVCPGSAHHANSAHSVSEPHSVCSYVLACTGKLYVCSVFVSLGS